VRRGGIQILATRRRGEDFVLNALNASLALHTRCGEAACEGAEVFVEWSSGARTVRTNRQGMATLQELPSGPLYVRVVWRRGTAEELQGDGTVQLRPKGRGTLAVDLAPPPPPPPALVNLPDAAPH
jgi:hypothetical protein